LEGVRKRAVMIQSHLEILEEMRETMKIFKPVGL
jgi:hypothetical protein